MYRHGFTTLEGVKNVVGAVGEVIDRLTLPAREKRQLEVDLLGLLAEHEKEVAALARQPWWRRPGEIGCSDRGGRW